MNIIFDFGRVLFEWKPDFVIASQFSDPKTSKEIEDGLFWHSDWHAYDQGAISKEDLIRKAVERIGVPHDKIKALVDYVPETMQPIQGTVALLPRLVEQGHTLYALSNMPLITMTYLEENNAFLDQFAGMVISSRVKQIKPNPEIYETILSKFKLDPTQTFFIDDTLANIKAADEFGIKSHQFRSPEICETWLIEQGLL